MSRAQEIVDEITASERYARMFEGRVFRDEPILATGRDVAARHRETKQAGASAHAAAHGAPRAGLGDGLGRGTQTTVATSSDADRHGVAPRTRPSRPSDGATGEDMAFSSMPGVPASLPDDLGGASVAVGPAPMTQAPTTSALPSGDVSEPLFIDLLEPFGPLGEGGDGGGGGAMRMQPRGVHLPHTLRALRRLERGHTSWSLSAGGGSKLFFDQARLTEDYTDDFEGNGASVLVSGPYPTYQLMSDYELRLYFAWRTRFRAGEAPACPAAFRLLHAFELLSGIGAKPGPEGLAELRRLASSYEGAAATNDAQMRRWIHDYVIYWDLPCEELKSLGGALSKADAVSLLASAQQALLASAAGPLPSSKAKVEWPATEGRRKEMGLPDESELLDALCALSRYRAEKSRFVRERRAEVAIVSARVFADMVGHCAKRRRVGYVEGLFGDPLRVSYTMFPQALFWTDTRHAESRYQVSPTEAYTCERGFWWHEMPCRRLDTSRELGDLLHAIDSRLRTACTYPHTLKARSLPKFQGAFVDGEIAWLVEERRRQEAARIRIDYSSLEAIRSSQVRIREALLTDEERAADERVEAGDTVTSTAPASASVAEETTDGNAAYGAFEETRTAAPRQSLQPLQVPASPAASGAGVAGSALGLTDRQVALLTALLEGGELPAFGAASFLSLEVDAINECFLDVVGDTVVEFFGEQPHLVEDYEDDVREALGL